MSDSSPRGLSLRAEPGGPEALALAVVLADRNATIARLEASVEAEKAARLLAESKLVCGICRCGVPGCSPSYVCEGCWHDRTGEKEMAESRAEAAEARCAAERERCAGIVRAARERYALDVRSARLSAQAGTPNPLLVPLIFDADDPLPDMSPASPAPPIRTLKPEDIANLSDEELLRERARLMKELNIVGGIGRCPREPASPAPAWAPKKGDRVEFKSFRRINDVTSEDFDAYGTLRSIDHNGYAQIIVTAAPSGFALASCGRSAREYRRADPARGPCRVCGAPTLGGACGRCAVTLSVEPAPVPALPAEKAPAPAECGCCGGSGEMGEVRDRRPCSACRGRA